MNDKLMDKIENLYKAVDILDKLNVIDSEELKDLSEAGLNKIVKEQLILRNDAISYFAELDDTKK